MKKKMIPLKGFLIPGICFDGGYCVWILNWYSTTTKYEKMREIWLFHPDGKRGCYIDPVEAIPFFRIYHDFDEVYGAEINITEVKNNINILVSGSNKENIELNIKTGFSLKSSFLNLLLKSNKNEKINESGKTETGKLFKSVPHKIKTISKAEFILNTKRISKLIKPKNDIMVGDGKVPQSPIISYCTHYIEK